MRFLSFILLIALLGSCEAQTKKNKESNSDPVLEKIAGKDYASMIELPTNQEGEIDSTKMARIQFKETIIDFDTIFEGDKISHSFTFINAGSKDLYLLQTNSSCGCTISSYSRDPIPNGKGGSINVTFNSSGKKGKQERKIAVISNAYPSETILTMQGYVKQIKTE